MQDYVIDVGRIEELQTINDVDSLDTIFTRAKSTIVNGAEVIVARGKAEPFERFTTLEDLEVYKKNVYKYL